MQMQTDHADYAQDTFTKNNVAKKRDRSLISPPVVSPQNFALFFLSSSFFLLHGMLHQRILFLDKYLSNARRMNENIYCSPRTSCVFVRVR